MKKGKERGREKEGDGREEEREREREREGGEGERGGFYFAKEILFTDIVHAIFEQ